MKIASNVQFIQPDWPAPDNVRSFCSTRVGGFSEGVFASFNTATHVNDQLENVQKNRALLEQAAQLPQKPVWLNQTHSTAVADLELLCRKPISDNKPDFGHLSASTEAFDASVCRQHNLPLAIQTADCLPILLCDQQGHWVAAVHAGWRGLLAGIVENTLSHYPSQDTLLAWIGPCIRQENFAVGDEVRQLFVNKNAQFELFFQQIGQQWFGDLAGIATHILQSQKVSVFDSQLCSFANPELFFSYRRDGQTGRMASLIWLESSEYGR